MDLAMIPAESTSSADLSEITKFGCEFEFELEPPPIGTIVTLGPTGFNVTLLRFWLVPEEKEKTVRKEDVGRQ